MLRFMQANGRLSSVNTVRVENKMLFVCVIFSTGTERTLVSHEYFITEFQVYFVSALFMIAYKTVLYFAEKT